MLVAGVLFLVVLDIAILTTYSIIGIFNGSFAAEIVAKQRKSGGSGWNKCGLNLESINLLNQFFL